MLTNREAATLVAQALEAGHVLTIKCPNGDTLTVGPKPDAISRNRGFYALRWGRSSWALPSGKQVAWDPMARFIAGDVIEHCGRGNAAKAARIALGVGA